MGDHKIEIKDHPYKPTLIEAWEILKDLSVKKKSYPLYLSDVYMILGARFKLTKNQIKRLLQYMKKLGLVTYFSGKLWLVYNPKIHYNLLEERKALILLGGKIERRK